MAHLIWTISHGKFSIYQIKTHVINEYLIGLCARLKLPKRRAAYARKLMMAMFKAMGSIKNYRSISQRLGELWWRTYIGKHRTSFKETILTKTSQNSSKAHFWLKARITLIMIINSSPTGTLKRSFSHIKEWCDTDVTDATDVSVECFMEFYPF